MIPKELSERIEALATVIAGAPAWNGDEARVEIVTLKSEAADLRALLTAAQGQEWTSLGPTNDRLIEIGYRDYVEPPQAEGEGRWATDQRR